MISAIILAGGKGKRMGAKISKQYIELNGKPILYYTLKRFVDCEGIDKIILVLPKDEIKYCNKEILEKYSLKVDMIVEGGKERQDSVYNALQKINDSEIVLIHDGARAFVSERVIKDGIKYAKIYGAAAPGVMPKDTIKVVDENGFSDSTPDRNKLLAIQTPQTFKLEIIKECHEKVKENNISVTDDTMVVEMYNNKVYLYNGEYTNIKVTTPEDLILAERLI
ncbi:MAG: 2-C-methyl-D-erythritol 4-phosphate cytidylyltransferase [Clostridium sp.]|uniref:2-C-methyl-D-erythritol 4-phosphate cytidylyltransferase n=1 Tax=Clostridium sp. TaxID=1506 RepID=UPI001EBF219D|nr:2-C-methyl-D-erythritol 4-phosphate cytidylyltransferase [Clostridium sp.]MBS5886656.1 2-C-methyl-D-erythritol 4-phosphate cytidylyltransferase [Clostridium sp.]MDU7150221.1 2-C-methyl-D-erythritol 4-phosphate cytidylyltransferase [Clostridium sp.]MDU7243431.1 2-C-methyl-D-erythritol 4-phosphate cytidylyltransferase [Clostridium sp.]